MFCSCHFFTLLTVTLSVSFFVVFPLQAVGPSVHLGYTVIFMLSVVYFSAGTFFVKHIESVD